jgi:hypothetical protein
MRKHIRSGIKDVNSTLETVQVYTTTRAILNVMIYIVSFDSFKETVLFFFSFNMNKRQLWAYTWKKYICSK